MKKTFILLTGIVCGSILLMGNEDGVAFNGKDRTGSPISTGLTCSQCHNTNQGNFNPTISARLKDANNTVVTSYIPGDTYTWEVEIIAGTGSPKFGFQSVALLSGNLNAGNFTALSSNSKVTTFSGRKYAEQTAPSTSGLFQLTWTAPAAGSGSVNFYTQGNAVNGTGTTSGDKPVSHPVVTITEQSASAIEEKELSLLLFPNPAQDFVRIESKIAGTFTIELFDLSGKIIRSESAQFVPGNYHSFSLEGIGNGAYFVYITNSIGDYSATLPLIKQ